MQSRRRFGQFIALIAFLCFFISQTAVYVQAEEDVPYPEIVSDYAVLIDADTGAVLFEKNAYAQAHPASTTKVLTGYLAIKYGNPDDMVSVTKEALEYEYPDSANLGIMIGESFSLKELLYGTLLYSANDMATQVGVHIGGGLEPFIEMMNREAEELGCVNTHFSNACGLPDEGHTTCAYDMALMMRAAMQQPLFMEIVSTREHMIPATTLYEARYTRNRVPLIANEALRYEPCLGGKTGFTDLALSTLVTCAKKGGHSLIAVTMHANSVEICGSDQIEMYEYGFANFDELFENARDTILTEEPEEEEEISYRESPAPREGEYTMETGETYVPYEKGSASAPGSRRGRAFAVLFGIILALLILVIIAIHLVLSRKRRRKRRRQQHRRQNR